MKIKILAFTVCCLLLFTACEKDGNLITVSGLESSSLVTSESNIVLTQEVASANVLAFNWTNSELRISDASMKIPSSVPAVILEVSASEDFLSYTEIIPSGNIYSFTGAALNTLGKNMGFTSDKSSPLYFRINSALGKNTKSTYSNVVTINITCYTIDMSIGFILDKEKAATGFTLYAPDSDGEYAGFTGTTAWGNWFLLEGDGTSWGNDNDGTDGTPFLITSDENVHWNFWYPGFGGCYYSTLSTASKEWTATYIPSLTVSGDIDAEMTFDKQAVKWYVSFTTTTDNATVKVNCNSAKLYNLSTGTDDALAIAKTIGFIPGSNNALSFDWNSESASDFTFGAAGDYTLTFYLSDPKNLTYEITSGLVNIVDHISKYLYLPGIDDGISGSWTFDNYLRLISEDDSTFAGAVLVNSLWGYEMTLEIDNWSDIYQMGATEGTLEFKSGNDITAPAPGLYLLQADLKNLTYSHTAITSLSYSGLNGDWSGLTAMNETYVSGVYTSNVTISTVSEWGTKLYLNGGWDYLYGGEEGVLTFNGEGITDDATIGTGTYDFIADVRNSSYVFLGNEVYITGLNDVWDFTSVILSKISTGVYSGTAVITTTSSYGITIHIDQSWNRYFGGSFSSLSYLGSNITDDQSLATGTYNVTVDFINNTCSFVPIE